MIKKMASFTKVTSVIVSDIIRLIDPENIGIDTKIRYLGASETDIWYKI